MTGCSSESEQILWLNGRFVPVREASISPLDRGFLYGDGVFETMRSEKGCILYLEDHLERMFDSLRALRINSLPELNWHDLAMELVKRNNLLNEVASLKIIVSRGICQGLGLPFCQSPTICIIAQKYHAPKQEVYQQGWRLQVVRQGFAPPLAKHKSLNYLYFMLARQQALDDGADEALILDSHGKVAETSAGSILARANGTWWTPANENQLPGVTVKVAARILRGKGREVQRRESGLDDLSCAETVWVLNSLLGIMPVYEIAGHWVSDPAAEEAELMRKELFLGEEGS